MADVAQDEPDPLEYAPPALPRWLDPRNSGGRTVLGSLLVVLTAWVLSVRQQGQVDTGPGPVPPTYTAVPVAEVPQPVGPGTYRDASLGTLRGPARDAAKLLGRLGEGDGVVPSGDLSCSPRRHHGDAQATMAAVVRRHLPAYGVITATSGFGRRAELCTLVLWAEHRSSSVVVSVAAPTRSATPLDTRWQTLSTASGTLEWVRRVDPARWTVLVASFGPGSVPSLSALLDLAHDPHLSW